MKKYQYDFSKRGWYNKPTWLDNFSIHVENTEQILFQHIGDLERDLLDVAMAVYVADRISLRAPGHSGDWFQRMTGRQFKLRIPVNFKRIWNQSTVKSLLAQTLGYLTTDEWEFSFEERTRHSSQQQSLFNIEHSRPFVGLFSGGLDSFAGAVHQALDSSYDTGVLVSAYSSARAVSHQRQLIDKMRQKLKPLDKTLVDIHLKHNLHTQFRIDPSPRESSEIIQDENTQRSRGFLFIALGFSIVRALGLNSLQVYENGVGAINLPHTTSGLGVDYTRAMNPEFLHKLSLLMSEVFETHMKIENPSLWKTKGQMCREIDVHGFGELAIETVSCDGFPRAAQPCGRCTSCLLRRVSLAAGGLEGLDQTLTKYKTDVYSVIPTGKNTDLLFELRCMEHQVTRIKKALLEGHPEKSLLTEFPELLRVRVAISQSENRDTDVVTRDLIALFRRYVEDWEWFATLLPKAAPLVSV